MIYFVLRPDNTFKFYSNLTRLCEKEETGYSYHTLTRHFAKENYWQNEGIQIWKGKPEKSKRTG